MLCPNCGFDNPSGTVFCAQCGRSLTRSGLPVGTYLVWQSDDGTPHAVAVTRHMTIGRTDGNDIVIRDSALSRQHARVEPTATGVAVVDLGSLNGVFVGGERIVEPTEVGHDSVIKVGRTELTVRVSESATASSSATGTMRIDLDPESEAEAEPEPSPEFDNVPEAQGTATVTMGASVEEPEEPLPQPDDESADRTILAAPGTWGALEEATTGPGDAEGDAHPVGFLVAEDQRVPIVETLTVGRAEGNDFRIQTDRMISRQHALLRAQPDGMWVEDLNSANGTYLNGTRVNQPLPVVDGDEIRFGSTSFLYESAPVAVPEPAPAPDLSSAETIVATVPEDWGLPSGFQIPSTAEQGAAALSQPEAAEAEQSEQEIDLLPPAMMDDSSPTLLADVEQEEMEDEQLQTLRGSEADLYIREAVAKEFEAIRRGDTEPFKPEGIDATDQHRLVVNFGAEAGRQFILYKDVTIIGRTAPDADFDIQLNDRAISRPHVKIVKDRDGFVIEDMDSANGTIINYTAEIKEPRRLKDGDIIKLGKTTLVYRMPASSRPDVPEPAYDPGVGQIITCFSLKGGVGTTTIATNLAVLLRQITGQPTLLIDLSTERGAMSVHLNLSPKLTLSDLPTDTASIEYEVLDSIVSRHDSGVDVLPAPPSPQTAELITPTLIGAILPIVKDRYKWVVIDTSATFSELNLGIFDQSDLFLLILSPDLASVKVMQSALDVFAALQVPAEKRVIVWNQIHGHPHLDREDVERTLGERIGFSVPFAADAILDSIDRGVPLAVSSRQHPTTAALEAFASSLAHVKQVAETQPRRGGFGQWVQGLISGVRR